MTVNSLSNKIEYPGIDSNFDYYFSRLPRSQRQDGYDYVLSFHGYHIASNELQAVADCHDITYTSQRPDLTKECSIIILKECFPNI